MDDTTKSLSIDIDTAALIQNAGKAKTAVKDLTDQLNALKAAGQGNTPIFSALSTQLKSSTTDLTNSTKALKDYTDTLTKKTQAEQADIKAIQDNNAAQQKQGPATPAATGDPNEIAAKDRDLPYVDLVGGTRAAPLKETPLQPIISDPNKEANDDAKAKADDKAKEAKGEKTAKSISASFDGAIKDKQTLVDKDTKLTKDIEGNYVASTKVITDWVGKNTIAARDAVIAKRGYAIIEAAINTETAVSSYITATAAAVKRDSGIPIIGSALAIADVALGAVQVAGAIANGVKQAETIKSITVDSKARGGIFHSDGMGAYLTGPGSGTSDSINARLSNGESVINARSTQMFGPILSAINQAGGGVAFHQSGGNGAYAMGGLFNGSNTFNDGSTDLANTRAMNDMVKTIALSMPRQVLVVEDVQASLQNKVMLQNMSNF